MIIATTIANILNYFFNIIVARAHGPSTFGQFSTLLAKLLIVTISAGLVQILIAKNIAHTPRFKHPDVPF